MREAGGALILIALAICFFAFGMDTAVPTSSAYGLPSSVYNLGLLQRQLMMFNGGCALFVAGCVLLAAGEIARLRGPGDVEIDHRGKANKDFVLVLVAIVILAALWFAFANFTSSPNTVSTTSGDAMAQNLEAEADRLEKLADEAGREADRLSK